MNSDKRRHELLLRYLDEHVSSQEAAQVEELLRSDPQARADLRQIAEHAVDFAAVERERKDLASTPQEHQTAVAIAPSTPEPAASLTTTVDSAPSQGSGEAPADDLGSPEDVGKSSFLAGSEAGFAITISAPSARRGQPRDDSADDGVRRGPIAPPDYEVLGRLGKGGMGVVYEARHLPLNRLVAVKMILAGKHAPSESLARFRQEAEAAAHLSHPNIVPVYEVGEFQGMPYLSMELLDGGRMSDLLSQASLTPIRSAELMEQVARAVHYSHQRGIVHRDLKPSNVLLTKEGVPKVADFGLARRLGDDYQEHTLTGEIVGTPGFMSPEQARGEKSIGPLTDVYALGAILYNALTGRAPFVGPTPIETIQQVVANDPAPPRRLQPAVDRDLETICMKCLEKEPSRRYQSAADVADDLRRFQNGEPILARPTSPVEKLHKWCKRNPRVAALSGLAAALVLALLIGGYVSAAIVGQQKVAEKIAREKAEENEKIALAQEQLARDQSELAMEAFRLVFYRTQEFFNGRPELADLREQLLQSMLAKTEELYAGNYDYAVTEIFRATAIRQLGQLHYDLGEREKALELFLESEAIAKRLVEEGKLPRPEMNLSNLDLAIGDAQRDLGNLDEARDRYLSMIEYRRAYFGDTDWLLAEQSLAQGYGRLGDVYRRLGQLDLAREHLTRTLQARRKWHELAPNNREAMAELAGALGVMSDYYLAAGELEEMEKASQESLNLLTRIGAIGSDYADLFNQAVKNRELGEKMLLLRPQEAADYLEESTKVFDRLLSRTRNARLERHAAHAHYLRGAYLASVNQPAAVHFDRAIELRRSLTERFPGDINYSGPLLMSLARAGRYDEAVKIADEFSRRENPPECAAYASLAYGFLWKHPDTPAERRADLAQKAVAQTRRFVQLGVHDFKLLRGETDYDFAALQSIPAFREMLDEEEAKLAKKKAKAP